ncbi:hypothetical protein ACH5RR_024966 [Cinchona calisaya]|uniref:Uncharacterized protein n=1 Tax=Cinchona calisaya TaxID=153742 RepID=A0ABD2YYA1_9GENT
MKRCTYQHNQQHAALVGLGFGFGGDSFIVNSSSMAACPNGVVCPKPRRPASFLPIINPQVEACESRAAGTELLDIILAKGSYGAEKNSFQVASSPPFFNGSPPVRASNPLIQDEQFVIGKVSPVSSSMGSSASPSSRKTGSGGSSGRVKCGTKPAPVRIEGFNCRGNCSISAVVA